jgi:hypothetical protein
MPEQNLSYLVHRLFVFLKPVNSNITQSNHGLGHWTGVMNSLPP